MNYSCGFSRRTWILTPRGNEMLRTRLLWFTFGFTSAAAAMTHLVFKDLWLDRRSLSTQLKQKFDALDTRVSNLETVIVNNSNPHQEGKLN